jgi:hypothetical protein
MFWDILRSRHRQTGTILGKITDDARDLRRSLGDDRSLLGRDADAAAVVDQLHGIDPSAAMQLAIPSAVRALRKAAVRQRHEPELAGWVAFHLGCIPNP